MKKLMRTIMMLLAVGLILPVHATESTKSDKAKSTISQLQMQNKKTSAIPININTATVSQLRTIKGIGVSKAKAIIEYRQQQGVFKAPEELMKVKGFSQKQFEKIKAQISIE